MGGHSFFTMLAIGCTKPRPYKTLPNNGTSPGKRLIEKSLFDTSAEYLYVPSSLNSTRTTDVTFPMYMGQAKIVRLQLTETALRVLEVDPEAQFQNNPVNNKPVLTVPISHVEFRCARDRDGKCTHQEEEDLSKPWASRSFIKILPDQLAVQEINFLPIEIANLFSSCHDVVSSAFESFEIEKNAINFGVEKTYKSNIACAGLANELSDLTFRVVYKYSLAKLSSVTSPDYKSLIYTQKEKSIFGFFDTNTLSLDRDNSANETGKKDFLNRWNPQRKVVYHLSENFSKPEFKKIKETTIKAIASLNHSLELAGTPLRIDLQEALPNMNPGDLRVNSIVMVEDPVNYGILGYGPTAANPRTGEIVHGRAAMYLGVLKTSLKRAYEDFVNEIITKQIQNKKNIQSQEKDNKSKIKLGQNFLLASEILTAPEKSSKNRPPGAPGAIAPGLNVKKMVAHAARLNERRLSLRDVALMKEDSSVVEQILSTNCFYSLENFDLANSLNEEIRKIIEEIGVKPWIELTAQEKDRVIDALLPFVWGPVLIHEMGHNLGLRHNFSGSEDKDNFYTDQELEKMGATQNFAENFAYSSIMDYGYRVTNELQVMGKYDVAALRFGYTEKLELGDKSGNLISIDEFRKNPELEIKPYRYCTDEHVDVNPGCKRFDEGTNLSEIAEHWIHMHEESYPRRNFRNGLANFSIYDDAKQISKLNLIFSSLRTMFERYEDIKKTYGLTDEHPIWESNEFLKDLKSASRLAGRFFIKVLQTPDTLCAVAEASDPNTIVAVVPIQQITTNAISCFDKENIQLNPVYVVAGQAGKSFQSKKDPNSTNPYMDQIDVRGIWLDKLLALNALTNRLTGISSFDEFTDNYLDLTDMQAEVQSALSALLLNEVVAPITIETISGDLLNASVPVRFYSHAPRENGHRILKPLHPGVQSLFKIPAEGVDFQVKLAQLLKANLVSPAQLNDENSLLNSIMAFSSLPLGSTPADYASTDIGLTRIFVNQKSKVASQLLLSREIVLALSLLSEEKLNLIKVDIAAGKAPADDASASEKFAYQLGAEVIDMFLKKEFQDRSYYELMLSAFL